MLQLMILFTRQTHSLAKTTPLLPNGCRRFLKREVQASEQKKVVDCSCNAAGSIAEKNRHSARFGAGSVLDLLNRGSIKIGAFAART
jgi:hypothetical protein